VPAAAADGSVGVALPMTPTPFWPTYARFVDSCAKQLDVKDAAAGRCRLRPAQAARRHPQAVRWRCGRHPDDAGGVCLESKLAILEAHKRLVTAGTPGHRVLLADDGAAQEFAALCAGYLSDLKKFRFDKIRIDQSFVRGICTDPAAAAIVRSTIELSQSLGMQTSAEGVESEDEAVLLRSFGRAEAQGYHFWRPLTAPAMRALVEDAVPMP
jgi:hypothetical protein